LKNILLLVLIFLSFSLVKGQENSFLKVYDHKKLTGNTLKVFAEEGLISISVLKPNLVEVAFLKEDINADQSLDEANTGKYIRVTQNLHSIYLQTDSLLLIVSKIDFSIRFKSFKGQTYLVADSAQMSGEFTKLNFTAAKETSFKNAKGRTLKVKDYQIKNKAICISNNSVSLRLEETVKGNLVFKTNNQFQYITNNSSTLVFQLSLNKIE
jgi:hypothetical protein